MDELLRVASVQNRRLTRLVLGDEPFYQGRELGKGILMAVHRRMLNGGAYRWTAATGNDGGGDGEREPKAHPNGNHARLPGSGIEPAFTAWAREPSVVRTWRTARPGEARVMPVVPRALVEALSDGAFVVVQAPPGFGKTTTVRRALAGEEQLAWYDAQPWERDGFVAALIERVREVRPDVGRKTLALSANGAPPERTGAAFAEELRHVEAPLRIVVDDAHVLGDSFAVFVRSLVRAMPSAVRVVLLTRVQLDVTLPEAVASGRGVLIDAEALRFDAAAVGALAAELGLPVDAKRAQAVAQRTEGWPLAAALALRTSSDALLEELVTHRIGELDAASREALEAMAAYETVEPAIAAPGNRDTLMRFERLAEDATLVARVAGGFRIHQLVRESLLRRIDAATLAARHAQAAAAYAEAGRLRPALFHLERAHASDADNAFLREHAAAAIASGLGEGVRTALRRVRAASPDQPALIALVEGLLAKVRGDDPRPALALAQRAADERDDDTLAFAARLETVEADLAHGDAVDADRIEDLLKRGREQGAGAEAAAATRAGWADAVAGRFSQSLARLDAVADNGDLRVRENLAPLEAYAHLALGHFETSERIAADFADRCSTSDELARYAGALVWAARFALVRGDTTAAFEYAREGERIARPFALPANEAAMHVTLAEAALHVGDTELARRAARDAQRSAGTAWYVRDAERTRALAGRITARAIALDGDPVGALAALDSSDPPALADAAVFAAAAGSAEAASRGAAAQRALESARPIDAGDAVALWAAAELLDFSEGLRGRMHVTRIVPGAFEALIARRSGEGTFKHRVEDEGAGPAFEITIARRLMAGKLAPHSSAPAVAPLAEPLTPREAEILGLLVAGLMNLEIAQRLILSARTVETHVARITGKFGVNSRARAVARAVALGLASAPADVA